MRLKFILFMVLILTAPAAFSGSDFIKEANIGPGMIFDQATNNVSINWPGSTAKTNCLTQMVYISTTASTVRILSDNTTTYHMAIPANQLLPMVWPDTDPFCVSAGSSMTIKGSIGGNGTSISYKGFIRR